MLFLLPSAYGQSAAVPALPVPLPAVVDPGWTAKCVIPKNGGTCTIAMPARTLLKASLTSTAATPAPISLSGLVFTWTCSPSADSEVITNPDGSTTTTKIMCSVTQVKP